MCIERAYLVAVLTKVMEQDIAILIFVKIFQLELQFFSLTTSLAITGIPRNFNTVNSLPEGGAVPKLGLPRDKVLQDFQLRTPRGEAVQDPSKFPLQGPFKC